jgi:predicted TIM-barrel fold metal-dependent hydrolase
MKVIDSHLHVGDLARAEYQWLERLGGAGEEES